MKVELIDNFENNFIATKNDDVYRRDVPHHDNSMDQMIKS